MSHGRKNISSRGKPVQGLNGERREENLRTKKPSAVRAERVGHTKVNMSHILQGSRALHKRLLGLLCREPYGQLCGSDACESALG